MSESCQLREIFFICVVSVIESDSNESRTLKISRFSSGLRLVSLARWWIWACVSDIFLYNMPTLYKKYAENQGYHGKNEGKWSRILWPPPSYCKTRLAHYCKPLLYIVFIYGWGILFLTDFDYTTLDAYLSFIFSPCYCKCLVFLYTLRVYSSCICAKSKMTLDCPSCYMNYFYSKHSPGASWYY